MWSFIEHATNYMARPRLGDKRPPTMWPSEASAIIINEWGEEQVVGKCRRATAARYMVDAYEYDPITYASNRGLVEELQAEVDPVDPYMLWIWAAGELYEQHCIELSKSAGVYIADQVQVSVPEIRLSGKIDLVLINPNSGKLVIDEIKSVYGYNSNSVLGTPSERKSGQVGSPRDSNLMQVAIYDWKVAKQSDEFENSRLTYGARDTGRYGEYEVWTALNEETGLTEIHYRGICPNVTPVTVSPITIDSIIDQYRYSLDHAEKGILPPRDFDLKYSEEKLATMYERGQLGKTDAAQWEKVLLRNQYNGWVEALPEMTDEEVVRTAHDIVDELSAGRARLLEEESPDIARIAKELRKSKPKASLKPVEKGDWQCRYCKRKSYCYTKDGRPRND